MEERRKSLSFLMMRHYGSIKFESGSFLSQLVTILHITLGYV